MLNFCTTSAQLRRGRSAADVSPAYAATLPVRYPNHRPFDNSGGVRNVSESRRDRRVQQVDG